jgi:hypothetical protein
MPAVSAKQKKFMDAAAHNPEFAKKAGIPTSVAQEFSGESKGKKFGTSTRPDLQGINKAKTDHGSMSLFKKGGAMKSDMKEDMKMDKSQDKAMIKKAFKQHDAQEHKGGNGTNLALKKGGTPKKFGTGGAMTTTSSTQPVRTASNTGSLPPRPMPRRPRPAQPSPTTPRLAPRSAPPRPKPDGFRGLFKRPTAPATPPTGPALGGVGPKPTSQLTPAKPGMKKGGGVEVRGKTKGKMVKMNRGGRAC